MPCSALIAKKRGDYWWKDERREISQNVES